MASQELIRDRTGEGRKRARAGFRRSLCCSRYHPARRCGLALARDGPLEWLRQPAELPIEQVARFKLDLNVKAAKRIGVIVPESVLVRADRIIE